MCVNTREEMGTRNGGHIWVEYGESLKAPKPCTVIQVVKTRKTKNEFLGRRR